MGKDRLSLTSLSDRLARKPVGDEASTPSAILADSRTAAMRRVQIIVRMSASERKALRQIALDQDTTAQALAEEAIRDVLSRHGYKPS